MSNNPALSSSLNRSVLPRHRITVAKAVASAVQLDVQMLTIHTGGGSEMMRAAEKSAQESAKKLGRNAPLVLGVTILTSLDSNAISEVGYGTVADHVLTWVRHKEPALS